MKRQCRYCNFCSQEGRMKDQGGRIGRKKYYCNHPIALTTMDRGLSLNTFIGFGATNYESPLVLKTTKRWCPLKKENKDVTAK